MATKRGKYYVRPDGLHEAIRTINGKRVAFRGKTDREVDRKILEYKEDAKKGRPFPVVADEWYREREKEVEANDLAHSTTHTYSFAVRRLKEAFPVRIGMIQPLDIKRYITEFGKKSYSRGTTYIELSTMRQICAYAVLNRDIDVSPAAEVKVTDKKLAVKKRNALTVEQEAAVERCRSGDWWLLGQMLLYTGMRRGELLALEWKDIDRKAGVIHVDKKLNYSFGNTPRLEQHLKSENGKRDIPLLQPLADVLPQNRVGIIFANGKGGYLTGAQLLYAWRSYCRTLGEETGFVVWEYDERGKPVEMFPVTPHCFRHSFATLCYESGIEAKTTAAWVGDTQQVVETVYQEIRKQQSIAGAGKLNEYLAARLAATV